MKDDYLWDGSGEPDPEIQRLENLLGRFRHNRPAPEFPEYVGIWDRLRLGIWLPRLAAVAAMVAVVAGIWYWGRTPAPAAPEAAWDVARLAGTPRIGTHSIENGGRLEVGQWLETDRFSRARIAAGNVGEVDVEPETRLRLVAARATEHRLSLDRGIIHAFISAPPRLFLVDTPSAQAIDLGCAYTLSVDDKGAGLLRVTFGWVEFESKYGTSLIPAGAAALTQPGIGPGTPYFEDASEEFKSALEKLDFEKTGAEARAAALALALREARKRDAFTLLNLLPRVQGDERGKVYDRLAELVPPPPGVNRALALQADGRIVDLWWDEMGVGYPLKK